MSFSDLNVTGADKTKESGGALRFDWIEEKKNLKRRIDFFQKLQTTRRLVTSKSV